MRMLSSCRIGCQIALVAGFGLVGAVAVEGVNWWGAARMGEIAARLDRVNAQADLEQQTQLAMLQARRSEKDFLLRRDTKSIDQNLAATQAADDMLARLAGAIAGGDPSLPPLVSDVRKQVSAYRDAFASVVRTARLVGLDEKQGLLGQLRAAVHDVEDKLKATRIPDAQIAMLMMRRHEKDFIARIDPAYGVQLRAQQPAFAAALAAADIAPDLRTELLARMSIYQALRCLAWMEYRLCRQPEVELPRDQIDHGFQVAG